MTPRIDEATVLEFWTGVITAGVLLILFWWCGRLFWRHVVTRIYLVIARHLSVRRQIRQVERRMKQDERYAHHVRKAVAMAKAERDRA